MLLAGSAIVPDRLQLGPAPAVVSPTIRSGRASLDPGVAWLSDFDAAVNAGMALRIPITAAQALAGFDRLVVLGLKSTISPADGAARLQVALEAHHYTSGLSFPAPGAATNATEQDRPADSGARETAPDTPGFDLELGAPLAQDPTSDGARVAALTGVSATTFDHVSGADAASDVEASWMNDLLWPATFGYFFWQITDPLLDDAGREAARQFFIQRVRARGPLPTLRVGQQPYGLLPVTSLDRWQPVYDDAPAEGVATLARGLRTTWRASVANVPRAGGPGDPDAALLALLGTSANPALVRARPAISRELAVDAAWFYGLDLQTVGWDALGGIVGAELAAAIGHSIPSVLLSELGLIPSFSTLLDAPWVVDPARPQVTSPAEYLRKLASVPPGSLWGIGSVVDARPVPILALVARHAMLREYAQAATRILQITGSDRLDRALVGIDKPTPQARDWLDTEWPKGSGTTLGQFLAATPTADSQLMQVRIAAMLLSEVPADRLELLLRETLGLSAARLDAWITALASKRLSDLRAAGKGGLYLGAYGWVEDLRPDTTLHTVPVPAGEDPALTVWQSAANKGHIHAPSLDQATTAAVLRSGYLTHAAAGHGTAVAVNLTSERVREAAWLLDAVREGQPLGALLGYRLERALHERHPGLDLDACIAPLRSLEPLAAGKLIDRGGAPLEAVGAANVVDGLRLLRRWQDGTRIPFGANGLPAATSAEGRAIADELDRLTDLVDGLSDTILAESVQRITTGRPEAAASTLDALSRGDTPPPSELDVARTPRRGVGITQRVGVLLRGAVTRGGWTTTAGVRAGLEPALEAWAASLLPDPAAVACVVNLDDAAGTALPDLAVRLGDLGMGALDFVYAAVPGETAEASEIERRVAHLALTASGAASARVRFDLKAGAAFGFPDALWQASELRALLDAARPITPGDLEPVGTNGTAPDPRDLATRLQGLATAMTGTADALDLEAGLVAAGTDPAHLADLLLAAASYGVRGTVPLTDLGDRLATGPELVTRTAAVSGQVRARAADLAAALAPGAAWDALAAAGRAALGSTIRLLPRFTPTDRAALDRAIAGSPTLMGGDAYAADDFLLDAARVRRPLARLTSVLTTGKAMRADPAALAAADFAAVQLPAVTGDRWVGLPLAPGAEPVDGRLSMLLHAPDLGGTGDPVAGLLVDEWVEVIPLPDVATGLAFHAAAPVAAAPQAVLLAVPPDAQPRWSLDALEAVLLETLDLARLRLVDLDALGDAGALAPAAWFAFNTKGDTVSTDFTAAVKGP